MIFSPTESNMSTRQFVTFWIGEDLFGIDILLVREINRNLEITRVDRALDYVRGIMNLRGQIVTIIDLGARLGLGKREMKSSTSCVVIKTTKDIDHLTLKDNLNVQETSTDVIGFLVDKIGDVVAIDNEAIEHPPAHAHGVSGRFLEGVIKLKDRLLITLRASEIILVE
ncbi:MAG: hypothetical protein A2Y14_00500 [Verrucomicrobia bacterium GWF2_51_19]|nr:MAG: hypothetical protein A2Y14_00500 [Verrucomicrobia bacterium GWF2_51_19]HCJ11866.1 chemotaxis protein CheW [Opitutae bacterium]